MANLKNLYLKHRKLIMKVIAAIVVAAALLGGCTALNKKLGLADDNIIEEAIENKIKDTTGLDLDLSPESKES